MESDPDPIAVVPLMSLLGLLSSDIDESDDMLSEWSREAGGDPLPWIGELVEPAPGAPERGSLMLLPLALSLPVAGKPEDEGSAASRDKGGDALPLADELMEPAVESREDGVAPVPPVAPLMSPPIEPDDTAPVVFPRPDALLKSE